MRIRNEYRRVSTARIRRLVDFVRVPGRWSPKPKVLIIRPNAAEAFHGFTDPWLGEVTIKLGNWSWYPFSRFGEHGYLSIYFRSPKEALVYLLAHEIRHLWQSIHDTPRLGPRAHKGFSEVDADHYAVAKLREWRRRQA